MRHGPVGFAVWGWSIRETADDPDSTWNPFRAIFLSFPGDSSGTIGSSPWSKRPASGSLIYDAETMICNWNFPCYLSLIDRQFINLEKGVSCFFTEKQNRLFPYMTHAIKHINCDLNNYNDNVRKIAHILREGTWKRACFLIDYSDQTVIKSCYGKSNEVACVK